MTDILTDDEGLRPAEEDPARVLDAFDVEERGDFEDDEADQTSLAMFEGDTATLFPDQRRCLNALLKQRYISAERHPDHWAVLMSGQDTIKSRLNDLFLELHVNRDFQVAFKRQAITETGDPLPSLLRDVANTKEESIVMVFLRQRFFGQRQEGEDDVFVDRQGLLDEVAGQRPEQATNRAMDHKRAVNAIDGLAKAGVLLKTADPERFRISPIIEVLMPIERLRALWAWLITQNSIDGTGPLDTGDAAAQDAGGDPGTTDVLFDLEGDEA